MTDVAGIGLAALAELYVATAFFSWPVAIASVATGLLVRSRWSYFLAALIAAGAFFAFRYRAFEQVGMTAFQIASYGVAAGFAGTVWMYFVRLIRFHLFPAKSFHLFPAKRGAL